MRAAEGHWNSYALRFAADDVGACRCGQQAEGNDFVNDDDQQRAGFIAFLAPRIVCLRLAVEIGALDDDAGGLFVGLAVEGFNVFMVAHIRF